MSDGKWERLEQVRQMASNGVLMVCVQLKLLKQYKN